MNSIETSAHACTPLATGTITQPFTAFYLAEIASAVKSSDLLKRMFLKRAQGPAADALWAGHCALERKIHEFTYHARSRGGLLFIGNQMATKVARALEGAAA